MIVRRKQITSQEKRLTREFEQLAADYLKQRHPALVPPDQELLRFVHDGIDHANRLRINHDEAVIQFLSLRLRQGVNFDQQPWAQPLHCAEPDGRIRVQATEVLLARSQQRT